MTGYAPPAVVNGPPRLPLPFGLFSVVSLAEQATERWENGVVWQAMNCEPANVVVGDCDDPQGFPRDFQDELDPNGSASAFTVYGTYKCNPIGGAAIEVGQEKARALLEAREQTAVEGRLWRQIVDSSPTLLTGGDVIATLGQLEKFIADAYGSLGVIHASRNAAITLTQKGLIRASGGQMRTNIGTPVSVGGGYPGTGVGIDEAQQIATSGTVSGGTFTLTFKGQTTGPIPWNSSAGTVQGALEALSTISVGDVLVSGGALPASPMVVSFRGAEADTDVPAITADGTALTGTAPGIAVTTTTQGGVTLPAAGHEFVAATPNLFGYRSQIFESTNRPGDLLDRSVNNLYGLAERNYLIGMDPCGVAIASLPLGCC
jgi:hypothetical protein